MIYFCCSIYLQQVNHARHLGVDENPVALRFESTQQDVQSVQLPALHDQALLVCNDEERDIEGKN